MEYLLPGYLPIFGSDSWPLKLSAPMKPWSFLMCLSNVWTFVWYSARLAPLHFPDRPYDCTIELLPGTTPPKGHIYSLSSLEREAKDKYIAESNSWHYPSTIVPGRRRGVFFCLFLFFVEKKTDKSLRPCTDYRGLDAIKVKNRYPLPITSTAFKLL